MKQKKKPKYLRYSNAKGKVIPMHHAFRTIHLGSVSRMSAVVLPVFFMALLWLFLPLILELWGNIFSFWLHHMYNSEVGYEAQTILGQKVYIPYPVLEAALPSWALVWINLMLCLVAFALSFLLPARNAPLTYLLRTTLLIQGSASIDRLLLPDFFPYTLKIYLLDVITECIYMLFILPLLLGLVYYIFDFSLGRKCWLTILMIGYFLIAIPCQYMLHAYIIHEWTLLFLPLMYMLFGVLMDVLMFISLYAYGMSWRSKKAALQGRGTGQ